MLHFDVARDVTETNAVLALEVFNDRAALENQESQPELAKAMALFDVGALAAPPEYTIFEVSSAESPT